MLHKKLILEDLSARQALHILPVKLSCREITNIYLTNWFTSCLID